MSAYPVHTYTREHPDYPEHLAAIADAPEILYWRGNAALLKTPAIAVVGTRQSTDYGIEVTRDLSAQLAKGGLCVVSGLALGIDAVAHRAALDAGGETIAVLGCGVDNDTIGPRQNVPLAMDILAHGGLVLSEYPIGSPADKWTFPARNRIISGLSKGVVVTEAAIKSGALITARLAADQGRDVYAVPGSIYWPRSQGPNLLISQGATVVTSVSDILEEYELDLKRPSTAVSTRDPIQLRIAAILDDGPAHIDSIIASSELPASQVMATLSRMELTGTVISNESGHYRTS